MSPTHQEFSNDITLSQIKSRVPVPLKQCPQFFNLETFVEDILSLPDAIGMDSSLSSYR